MPRKQALQRLFTRAQELPLIIHHGGRTRGTRAWSHYHQTELELQFAKNSAGFYFVRNRKYALKKNSVLIIHKNELHHYWGPAGALMPEKFTIMCAPRILDQAGIKRASSRLLRCSRRFNHQIILSDRDFALAELLAREAAVELAGERLCKREMVLASLAKIVVIVLRNLERGPEQRPLSLEPGREMARALDFIEDHFRESLSLADMAREVSFSPAYFSRSFRRYAGMNFKKYLISRRIIEAKRLLEETGLKILVVSRQVGFSEISTFNKDFKRLVGSTPVAFRKLFH